MDKLSDNKNFDDLEFYKEIFNREIQRRIELDDAINIPIGGITLLSGLMYYISADFNPDSISIKTFHYLLIGMFLLSICLSLIFIAKSYNNFFKGNGYEDLPKTKELREYQLQIIEYNKKSDEKDSFIDYLIEKYVNYADKLVKINDRRSNSLYYAKTFLIVSMIITLITTIYYSIIKLTL